MINLKVLIAIFIFFLCHMACHNTLAEKQNTSKAIEVNNVNKKHQKGTEVEDSFKMNKGELTKNYTQAISEFIKIAYNNDKTIFDTLFFGKHVYGHEDDFPDISLPHVIQNTHIRIISPELGQKIQIGRKTSVYVNLMGWFDNNKAEFLFVVFSNGAVHQYDYHLYFQRSNLKSAFELVKIEYENFLQKNDQNKKITLFDSFRHKPAKH